VVEIGIGGEQVEDEAFYDAASIAAMRIGCLPGNARNASCRPPLLIARAVAIA
jgi:hypothetical protein